MRVTVFLDEETHKASETLLQQGKFPNMSALVRHAIKSMDQTQYEKVLLREIRELKQLFSSQQDKDDEPPPTRRRRGQFSYKDFEETMDQHKDDEQNPTIVELCRKHPDFLKRYRQENF